MIMMFTIYNLNYLGKKAVRALSRDLLGPARPAPARALTPRPRWKLTRPDVRIIEMDKTHLSQLSFQASGSV